MGKIITRAGSNMPDLKPFTGGMFVDVVSEYTHWGWIVMDGIYGDLSLVAAAVRKCDVATLHNALVCVLGKLALQSFVQ